MKCLYCNNPAISKKMCNMHYLRSRSKFKNKKSMEDAPTKIHSNTECLECGSLRGTKGALGLCSRCYKAYMRNTIMDELIQFLGGKCSNCHNSFHRSVYDFHHIDPTQKEFSIGDKLGVVSPEALKKEAIKCLLLCANCHRLHHYYKGK